MLRTRRIRNYVGPLGSFEPRSAAAQALHEEIAREEGVLTRLRMEGEIPALPMLHDDLACFDEVFPPPPQQPAQVVLMRDLVSEEVRGIKGHPPTPERIRPTMERFDIRGTIRKAELSQGVRFGRHEVHVSLDLDLNSISTTVFSKQFSPTRVGTSYQAMVVYTLSEDGQEEKGDGHYTIYDTKPLDGPSI